jgi:hypothetical protein
MQYMKFEPKGHNLWAVQRRRPKGEMVNIGEVALQTNGVATFIPIDGHAFSIEEVNAIGVFMHGAAQQPTSLVLPKTGKSFTL